MSASDATPEWLLSRPVALCPCGCIGRRRRGSFIDKTIARAADVMRQAMFNQDVAEQDGLLQRIDARVKLLTLVVLLLAVAFLHHVPALAAMYVVTVAVAVWSGVRLGFFVKRVWLFIPIFTGVVVLPATFSFITPGEIVVPLGNWFGHGVGLTRQGLTSAALIVLRVATSISIVVLITLTTRWTDLLGALGALRVPPIFVLVIGMAYRYVFTLLGVVTDMFVARKARTVAASADHRSSRAFVAASAGTLFGKAHAMSEEVHQAMVARGYRGRPRALVAHHVAASDLAWLVGCVAAAVIAIGGDRLLGG